MRVKGFEIEVSANVTCKINEYHDESEVLNGLEVNNTGAHVALKLDEMEVTPEETKEVINSVSKLVSDQLHMELEKNMLRKEIEELKMKNNK